MNPRLPYTQNPDPTYAGYERAISEQLLVFPGFRIWWQQSRSVFSPGFVTLPRRQAEGLLQPILSSMGVDLEAADHTTLCCAEIPRRTRE